MAQTVNDLPAMWEARVQSLDGEDPPGEGTGTTVSLPGESHGQRSLVGYSPWGHEELDMTEQLTHTDGGGKERKKDRKKTQPRSLEPGLLQVGSGSWQPTKP